MLGEDVALRYPARPARNVMVITAYNRILPCSLLLYRLFIAVISINIKLIGLFIVV